MKNDEIMFIKLFGKHVEQAPFKSIAKGELLLINGDRMPWQVVHNKIVKDAKLGEHREIAVQVYKRRTYHGVVIPQEQT